MPAVEMLVVQDNKLVGSYSNHTWPGNLFFSSRNDVYDDTLQWLKKTKIILQNESWYTMIKQQQVGW